MPAKRSSKKLICRGDEAHVYRFPPVTVKGRKTYPRKRDVVRVSRRHMFLPPLEMFYRLKLARVLFPDNFIRVSRSIEPENVPEPLEALRESLRGSSEQRLYSEHEETTSEYRDFARKFYRLRKKHGPDVMTGLYGFPIELKGHPHLQLVEKALPLIEEMRKAGIDVNAHPVNIAQTIDGRIIFFEIDNMHPYKLFEYLGRLPESRRKKAAASLRRYLSKITKVSGRLFKYEPLLQRLREEKK